MKVCEFDFKLPEELIASQPLEKRDASRMLVVPEMNNRHVWDILEYLKPGDIMVLNNSRVLPSRFIVTDVMGRDYEMTLHTMDAGNIWFGMCLKSRRIKIGDELTLIDGTKILVLDKSDESGLKLQFLVDDNSIVDVLNRVGEMPLPPYMKRRADKSDNERYQTVYSKPVGSMAAPTAGLHITNKLLDAIKSRGVKIVEITLHVGAGTFLPVKVDDTNDHKMHSEYGEITTNQAAEINNARANGGRVIAIGTTSLRLLESASRDGRVHEFFDKTSIFITPGYKFQAVDILLTNFHLPCSTLFMLVSAFAGLENMKAAYQHAIDEKYRFYSYGDCCLLFRN